MKHETATKSAALNKNGTGSTRREFICAVAGLTLTGAIAAIPGVSFGATIASASDPVKAFITVSQTITEHKQIDSALAARFLEVFTQRDPQFVARISQLERLAIAGIDAKQFMTKATQAGLNEFLYQIVTAWYTGTVGDDYHGTLVAYKQALMYQTVRDGLVVPTYCGKGPMWWTAPVPDENDGLIASL